MSGLLASFRDGRRNTLRARRPQGRGSLAPENTIESLAAALDHGVDMVEFDVVDAPDGTLVLAHSHEEIEPDAVTLDEALAFLAVDAPEALRIDLDLK